MTKYFQLLSFLLFYSLYCSNLCQAIPYSCPHDQSLLLQTFKESFSTNQSNSNPWASLNDPWIYFNNYYCQSSYPKTNSWNISTDCCTWEGVTCDKITGNVVELDLSCSQLNGSIDSDSSIFRLPHLQSLNLACNRIKGSRISMMFGNFSHLAHLNLSRNEFSGQVPSEILKLTELTSLDLSYNSFTVGPDIFKSLLTNFSQLSQVSLTGLNILSSIPKNLSSSLESVQLHGNNLHGNLPHSIFQLPNLKTLDLGGNSQLYGLLPNVIWNSHRSLEWLDLSEIQFSGKIPDSIGNLKALKYLSLLECAFNESLPKGIFVNMTQIEIIILANNRLVGSLPLFAQEIKHLKVLSLYNNSFTGTIKPSGLPSLSSLQNIDLSLNQLTGQVPKEFSSLVNLQSLALTFNQLSGTIPMELSALVNLQELDLSFNRLSGQIPMELSSLVNLLYLYLYNNQLSGHVPKELSSLVNLQWLHLYNNQLSGPVPKELSSLVNLESLDLSSNNFSGHVDVEIFSNMKQLKSLALSHNRLSLVSKYNSTLPTSIDTFLLASCNISELLFLRSAPAILSMDLSMNNIVEVPSWLWFKWSNIEDLNISYNSITHVREIQFQQIRHLDIRTNLFRGQFPQVPMTITHMFISDNQFSGVIPSSIVCKLSNLEMLDVSNNSFTGSIPQCIGHISQDLLVLDMRMNNFEGAIPTNFSSMSLITLNLHGNHLRGNIPTSLVACVNLKVLDLGNNNLTDSFPSWLGVLPNLIVLSLRSNNFHGKILLSATTSFSKLQILDLSHNQFIGTLPSSLFERFSGMMHINKTSKAARYLGDYQNYYKDSTTLVNKGIEVELVRILTTWTTIDVSSNNFEGSIPNSLGRLISIRQLYLSNNMLEGEIPISFGNLSVLESLDLSSNQLTGTIPTQLATLTSLSKLNLSHNHLTGRIPSGPQFQTFQNDSYIDNDGLCGIPLSETCEGAKEHVVDYSDDSDFFYGLSWRCVLIGYGVGMVLGLWIGFIMIFTETPKWLIRMVEDAGHTILMKRDRKKKSIKRTGRNN